MLDQILARTRQELARLKREKPLESLQEQVWGDASSSPHRRSLKDALKRNGPVKILAEIKRASPSRGTLRSSVDPAAVAKLFQQSGAAAISVLTEPHFFNGSDRDLREARAAVTLPVLRKDFVVDTYQIWETRAMGADAVLLMAQVLKEDELREFRELATKLGLECLVEGHTEDELKAVVNSGAEIVGINNRDLRTLQVSLDATIRLRTIIPADRVLVSQSGISSRQDVERLAVAGVDAVQVGTALMLSGDISRKLRELVS